MRSLHSHQKHTGNTCRPSAKLRNADSSAAFLASAALASVPVSHFVIALSAPNRFHWSNSSARRLANPKFVRKGRSRQPQPDLPDSPLPCPAASASFCRSFFVCCSSATAASTRACRAVIVSSCPAAAPQSLACVASCFDLFARGVDLCVELLHHNWHPIHRAHLCIDTCIGMCIDMLASSLASHPTCHPSCSPTLRSFMLCMHACYCKEGMLAGARTGRRGGR